MAKIKAFRAEYGTSVETLVNGKSVWHKLYAAVEVEVEPGDDFREVAKKTWDTAIGEVEKQVEQVLESY